MQESTQARLGFLVVVSLFLFTTTAAADDLLMLENKQTKVGIDRKRGAAITWLSSAGYPKNMVNLADPGRLIQQSYYAGKPRNRLSEGQSKAWSPWTWNPIQGGGVNSWARTTEFKKNDDKQTLYSETIPKLWDMPNEEASARMRQWTSFEEGMPNVIVVRCELICERADVDLWGPAVLRHQEIPACYFTRNFERIKSYQGKGKWENETQKPGPPWGKVTPPTNAMACFDQGGQGVAVYSPCSTDHWNFGPHGAGVSDDPRAGPCIHVAPLNSVKLGPDSIYRYRYWLVLGDEATIEKRLDLLISKYAKEQAELTHPKSRNNDASEKRIEKSN